MPDWNEKSATEDSAPAKYTFFTGSVEISQHFPGHSKLVTRDGAGRIVSEVNTSVVCIGDTSCFVCGRELSDDA